MSQKTKKERERWDIIVAEDNDDHALLIQMALERAAGIPVDVRRARNGEEAVKLLEESPPDLPPAIGSEDAWDGRTRGTGAGKGR
ncbi:MAG: hypothetical protein IH968_05575 [Gemmatimonadetes bacterium]|nr:hypothetical protein [Gemmatimonadota bacterium]